MMASRRGEKGLKKNSNVLGRIGKRQKGQDFRRMPAGGLAGDGAASREGKKVERVDGD